MGGGVSELRLIDFARAEIGRPFAWGDTNCVALAVRWLDTMRGTDIAARHRRSMASAARAAAWTRAHGARGLVDTLLSEGLTEIVPVFAQPGDVLIGETSDGQIAAHIYLGTSLLASTAADGVRMFKLDEIAAPRWVVGWRAA